MFSSECPNSTVSIKKVPFFLIFLTARSISGSCSPLVSCFHRSSAHCLICPSVRSLINEHSTNTAVTKIRKSLFSIETLLKAGMSFSPCCFDFSPICFRIVFQNASTQWDDMFLFISTCVLLRRQWVFTSKNHICFMFSSRRSLQQQLFLPKRKFCQKLRHLRLFANTKHY